MSRIGVSEIAAEDRDAAGTALQEALVDLVALALNGKQAHWHVTGPQFVPAHEQLDTIVNDCRAWGDLVAERAITLGVPVDGRADMVASSTALGPFPEGFVDAAKAVAIVSGELGAAIARMRSHLDELAAADPVTQDLVIEVVRGLEKHLWMLQAQLA